MSAKNKRKCRDSFLDNVRCPDCNEMLCWYDLEGEIGDLEAACACDSRTWYATPSVWSIHSLDEKDC